MVYYTCNTYTVVYLYRRCNTYIYSIMESIIVCDIEDCGYVCINSYEIDYEIYGVCGINNDVKE